MLDGGSDAAVEGHAGIVVDGILLVCRHGLAGVAVGVDKDDGAVRALLAGGEGREADLGGAVVAILGVKAAGPPKRIGGLGDDATEEGVVSFRSADEGEQSRSKKRNAKNKPYQLVFLTGMKLK